MILHCLTVVLFLSFCGSLYVAFSMIVSALLIAIRIKYKIAYKIIYEIAYKFIFSPNLSFTVPPREDQMS